MVLFECASFVKTRMTQKLSFIGKKWSVSCSVVSDSLRPRNCRLLCPGKNTRVGCHSLLRGIFLTQQLNPGLLHCRQILYQLSHWGKPKLIVGSEYRKTTWLSRSAMTLISTSFLSSWMSTWPRVEQLPCTNICRHKDSDLVTTGGYSNYYHNFEVVINTKLSSVAR